MTGNLYSTRQCKIWSEMIEKEDLARLHWYERARRGDLKGQSMRFEVFKKQLERNTIKGLNVRQLPAIEPKKRCRQSVKTLQRGLDKAALTRANQILCDSHHGQIFDMYPVEVKVREKLYQGFTKEEKGRYDYLKVRKSIIPEKKYQFPLCSSWDYGWHHDEHVPKETIRNPVYGRRAIVESDFFTRNELPQYHHNRHLKPDDARATILMAD